jgi:hypothetical protein
MSGSTINRKQTKPLSGTQKNLFLMEVNQEVVGSDDLDKHKRYCKLHKLNRHAKQLTSWFLSPSSGLLLFRFRRLFQCGIA